MVTIQITYHDRLSCEAVHGPSGQRVEAAFPDRDSSRTETFSPTDLVAAAYGACLAIQLGCAAEAELLDLKGMKIVVTKEMVDAPLRRIARLSARIEIPIPLTSGMKASLERAARTCPVRESLRAEIETAVQFVFV